MLDGGAGNDTIDGAGGTDTPSTSGNLGDYSQVQNGDGSWTVTDLRSGSPDGTDTLKSIEYLQFADQTVAAAQPLTRLARQRHLLRQQSSATW